MKSNVCLSSLIIAIILLAIVIPDINARPHRSSRQKRVSDQRLAELETLLALAKMRGKLVTVPIGFGRIDPAKIGRRRRRSSLKTSTEDYEVEQMLLEENDDQSSGDFEERSGSSPQYEDLLRQYLLAWAREESVGNEP